MAYSIDLVELVPQTALAITVESTASTLAPAFERTLPAVFAELQRQGLSPSGPPYGRYHHYSDAAVTVEIGIPVNQPGAAAETEAGLAQPVALPGGEAAGLYHVGPYECLRAAYQALEAWLAESGRNPLGSPWENYVVDPSRQPDPKRWRTRVLQPLQPLQSLQPAQPAADSGSP